MFGFFSAMKWSMAWAAPHLHAWTMERSRSRSEAEHHLQSRNFAEAEKHLIDAIAEADVRQHSVRKIQFRLQLAESQRKQGKFEEAEQTVRTALEFTAKISNPAGYVQCLDALAEVFHDAGDYAAMEAALQKAVTTEASIPHPDPLRMARRVARLGTARHKAGRSEEAIPALEKALRLHEGAYGEEHLETASLLSDLGEIHRAQGNHGEAQVLLKRALRVHERELGYDSPEAVRDLHHLAGSHEEAGDIESAANLYERALQLKLRVVGGNLEELAEMQFGLAGIYIGWGNYARSRELLAEAVGTFKRKKDTRLAVAYETMAHVEECSGRYLEAITELGRATKIWEQCSQDLLPHLIENLEHRAELLEILRRKGEASWLRERVAQLRGEATQAHSA